MDTTYEKKYMDLVVAMIMHSNRSDDEKTESVKSLLRNHSYCYENFCFNVDRLTTLPGTNVLLVDDLGISYVNPECRQPGKKYYEVLTLNEYSPACGDVIVHIKIALEHLEELLLNEQSEGLF